MKKIILVLLLVCCTSAVFAQADKAGNALKTFSHLSKEEIVRGAIGQQMRYIGRRMLLEAELAQYNLIPLTINGAAGSWPTVFAFPLTSANNKKEIVGNLRPYNYGMSETDIADKWLSEYLMNLGEEEDIHFVYRGMHLADLESVKNILLHGLRVDKTHVGGVYVTTAPILARHHARTQITGEIPVFVTMDQEDVVDYLQPKRREYFSGTDIPAEAISHLFAFLNIDGKLAWYRVVLTDKMIFIPLPEEQLNIR